MTDLQIIPIREESDIVVARKAGRDLAAGIGFRTIDCVQIATAISELARNIILYAGTGVVSLAILTEGGAPCGLEVVARDQGPGIPDAAAAMRDGFSTSKGLGLGLPGTRRLVDEFNLESRPGQGTTVTVRKYLVLPKTREAS